MSSNAFYNNLFEYRDAGEHPIAPLPFQRGETGAEVPFYKIIIGNFMVYQDRIETNSCTYSRTHKLQNVVL